MRQVREQGRYRLAKAGFASLYSAKRCKVDDTSAIFRAMAYSHSPYRPSEFTACTHRSAACSLISASGSKPLVSRIRCRGAFEPDDEIRLVVVRLTVMEIVDGEAKAGVLDERGHAGMRVNQIRRSLLPLLGIGNHVIQVAVENLAHIAARPKNPPRRSLRCGFSIDQQLRASPCDVSGRIASTSRSITQP